jgi:hypothetical protein
MTRRDRDFDKLFELEPTEYRRADQPEPVLGFNGSTFLIVGGFTWVIGYCLSWLAHQLPLTAFLIIALPAAWVLAQVAKGIIALADFLWRRLPLQ